jgi:hypothetical protein
LTEILQNQYFSNIWILFSFLARFRQLKEGCLGERWGQNKRKEIKEKEQTIIRILIFGSQR